MLRRKRSDVGSAGPGSAGTGRMPGPDGPAAARSGALEDVEKVLIRGTPVPLSGLMTCVTHCAQGLRDTSPSAGGVERGGAAVSGRAAGVVRGECHRGRRAVRGVASGGAPVVALVPGGGSGWAVGSLVASAFVADPHAYRGGGAESTTAFGSRLLRRWPVTSAP